MITISCEIYAKFAQLALTAADKDWRVVRLEHKGGKKYAVASDRKNAVVYLLGETDQPDGAFNIVADAAMIAACTNEIPFKGNLEIVAIPGVGASAKTTFGFVYSGNAVNFEDRTKLADWRTLYEPIKKSRGAMFWNVAGISQLAAASISGSIRFPEFIDGGKPVIVRDVIDPNWYGLFMANRFVDGQSVEVEPATLPDWAK
jgi:hypothetical protein